MKLTTQEQNFIEYLSSREEAYWEELVQFCKDPTTVKLKTVQKVVSDIKKKFRDENQTIPFNSKFSYFKLPTYEEPVIEEGYGFPTLKITHNGQTLVKLKRPVAEPVTNAPVPDRPVLPVPADTRRPHQIEFAIKRWQNQVISRSGAHVLSSDDLEVFEYLYNNYGEVVTLEELRDKVVFPKFGSKLPARWWDSIQRRINNVRRAVPELKNRILTVKTENNGTGYFFK